MTAAARRALWLGPLAAIAAGCAVKADRVAPGTGAGLTTVEGSLRVWYRQRPDPNTEFFAFRPFAEAEIAVRQFSGEASDIPWQHWGLAGAKRLIADANGEFRVQLDPGRYYLIHVIGRNDMMDRALVEFARGTGGKSTLRFDVPPGASSYLGDVAFRIQRTFKAGPKADKILTEAAIEVGASRAGLTPIGRRIDL